jgi:hypothetical protein
MMMMMMIMMMMITGWNEEEGQGGEGGGAEYEFGSDVSSEEVLRRMSKERGTEGGYMSRASREKRAELLQVGRLMV